MSFFDRMMINEPLPNGWTDYDLHTEVNENDYHLIHYLEKTMWIHFADGGHINGTSNGIDSGSKTRWYGLKRNVLLS